MSTSLQKKSDFFEPCHESAILVDFCMDSLLSRENKNEKKKNGIEKINEITKKPSWESHRDFIM